MVSTLKQYLRPDIIPEYVDLNLIRHSPLNARDNLDNLESLVFSIRQNGLLQPIIVRPKASRFEVVAGNRRLEACKKLHWVRIPCLVKELNDKQSYEIGLIENIERETLSPVEIARAFEHYVKENGWGGVKSLAESIGRSEEYVSHKIALLSLPPTVLELIKSERIASSTAHELIWLKNSRDQKILAQAVVEKKLSAKKVREVVVVSRKNGLDVQEIVEAISSSKRTNEKLAMEKCIRLLDKSILTLRIAMLRLDSIIEEADDQVGSDSLRELLIKRRLNIHNQIDEVIRFKKSINVF